MTQPFGGHFDGRGHTVTYTVKAGEKEHGLFPYLAGTEEQAAEVRDLKVVVEEYSPKKDAAGGALVCRAEKSIISGVSVTLNKYAAPADGDSAGGAGIVGTVAADAFIENCNVKAAAGDYRNFGGIANENGGTVKNCEFVLNEGRSSVGDYGGISRTSSGVIADCRTSLPESTVTAAPDTIGGITALASGEITGCTAIFQLTGTPAERVWAIGGIAGVVEGGRIADCTVRGSLVLGWWNIGGIAGRGGVTTPLTIENCVSELQSIGSPAQRANNHLGGILGGAEKFMANITVRGCTASTDIYGGVDYGIIGGLVGYWRFGAVPADGPTLTFTLEDCHSYGKELNAAAGRNVGGAIGYIGNPTDSAGALVQGVPTKSVVRNCTASANVTIAAASAGGGFIGQVDSAENGTDVPTFENCRASGDVRATGSAGGFVGNIMKNSVVSFHSCTAEGNVAAKGADAVLYNNAGGFVGYDGGKAVFTDCLARGDASGNNYIGGFAGACYGPGSAYGASGNGCYSYGSVTGYSYSGGFIGYTNVPTPGSCTFTDSHAFGNVNMKDGTGTLGMGGGFIGEVNGSTIRNCTASGDLTVDSDKTDLWGYAGFVANAADANNYVNSIESCKSFGNVIAKQQWRVGGFVGQWGDYGGTARMTNCESYGSVVGRDCVGGFVGELSAASVMSGNASYCPSLVATGPKMGSFAGNILDDGFHNLSANKYTELPDCPVAGGSITIPDTGGAPLAPEEVKVSPKSVLSVALTPVGSATKVAFAFTNATGYSLISFEISTDAGKTYTALVWDKVALVDLPAGALTCANFSYTYAAPCNANTKVRVKISNGTDTVTTEFTYK